MPTIAIISQKGGAGKTALALHLAAAARGAGAVSLIIDTDPQATASQWSAWRQDAPPEVTDSPPPRLAAKIVQATTQGAERIVVDTPPHADSAAVEVADLVPIPCQLSAFDLAAIQTSANWSSCCASPPSSYSPPVRPMRHVSIRKRVTWWPASACRPAR